MKHVPHTAVAAHRDDGGIRVLQGGGALGAYQAGAIEALGPGWREPGWVAGVSIGAINAALGAATPAHRAQPLDTGPDANPPPAENEKAR